MEQPRTSTTQSIRISFNFKYTDLVTTHLKWTDRFGSNMKPCLVQIHLIFSTRLRINQPHASPLVGIYIYIYIYIALATSTSTQCDKTYILSLFRPTKD